MLVPNIPSDEKKQDNDLVWFKADCCFGDEAPLEICMNKKIYVEMRDHLDKANKLCLKCVPDDENASSCYEITEIELISSDRELELEKKHEILQSAKKLMHLSNENEHDEEREEKDEGMEL